MRAGQRKFPSTHVLGVIVFLNTSYEVKFSHKLCILLIGTGKLEQTAYITNFNNLINQNASTSQFYAKL